MFLLIIAKNREVYHDIVIKSKIDFVLYYYSIKPEKVEILTCVINQFFIEIQYWIRFIGNYYIFNLK